MAKKPFILLTTSRRPSKNTRTFCRDLSNTFPNIVRINRGKLSLDGVAEKALEHEAEKVIIIGRRKGDLEEIQFFRISENGLDAIPPLVHVRGVKLRRDFEEDASRERKVKCVAIAASKRTFLEIEKLESALSEFFSIPVFSLKEIYSRRNDAAMQISADAANRIIITFKVVPELVEVGPQIRVSHLVWELTQ